MPTWRELERDARERLGDAQEARWLAQQAAGRDAAEWLRDLDDVAPARCVPYLDGMVERRLAGEPLQLVLGRWGFRHLDLGVARGALIPRPETEQVVQHAIDAVRGVASPTVVDLGTGTGAIALSLATEVAGATVWAVDASAAALAVASANVAGVGGMAAARVRLVQGSWYEPLPAELVGAVDLVVSNPPYLAAHELAHLDAGVRDWDPHEALVAGASGYEAIEAVVAGAPRFLRPGGVLVVEHAPWQGGRAIELALAAGFATAETRPDLAERPRCLVARLA